MSLLRVLLIAGETSGDLHGAALVRALRQRLPDIDIAGVGGEQLRAAGMRILVDTASVATMGVVETFGTLGRLLRTYRTLKRFLDEERPHLLVLIDYPEFNLMMARQAKRRGIPVFYFIGPQVWAWRGGRVRKIARLVDKMAVVFPFEAELYNNGRQLAEFIGHPLLDVVAATAGRDDTRRRHGLALDRPVLALLPGSRPKEVRYLLQPLAQAAKILSAEGWQPIICLASGLETSDLAAGLGGRLPEVPFVQGDTYNIVAAADAAVVTSGTATLETALLGCPMVIVYRTSPVTMWIARRIVHTEWLGMPNIIMQREVFPELIQEEVTGEAIASAVRTLAVGGSEAKTILADLRAQLGEPGAADRAATLALALVGA